MQKKYLQDFLEEYQFPLGTKDVLFASYERVQNSAMFDWVEAYRNKVLDYDNALDKVRALAVETGVHEYTLILLFLICLADVLKDEYVACGMDLQVWRNSMFDLKYKALDCQDYCGVWGTKDAPWHKQFFILKRFGFEKLQFNVRNFDNEYHKDGIALEKESPVLAVHIPQTGEKLDYESVQRAYQKAVAFFRTHFADTFADKPIVFLLSSWMLFDKLREVLKPQSNFALFCNDYDVFRQDVYEDYSSLWRVFHKPYDGNVENMPQDTSLQRAYIKWIKQGEKIGGGWGVYCPPYAR